MTTDEADRHAELLNRSGLLRLAASRLVRESREERERAKLVIAKVWCMVGQRATRSGASPADQAQAPTPSPQPSRPSLALSSP